MSTHTDTAHHPDLAHHFEDLKQQNECHTLGMWLFLATEVLFFGGLFAAFTVYKSMFYPAFVTGSHELSVQLGGLNTAFLITSSLTMALAVHAAQTNKRKSLLGFLYATLALGGAFLVVKYFEYSSKFEHHLVPGANFHFHSDDPRFASTNPDHLQIFFVLYFCMTGLHGIHVTCGLAYIVHLIRKVKQGAYSAEYHTPIENFGLYWHLVDLVWIYLFPLLYLLGRH